MCSHCFRFYLIHRIFHYLLTSACSTDKIILSSLGLRLLNVKYFLCNSPSTYSQICYTVLGLTTALHSMIFFRTQTYKSWKMPGIGLRKKKELRKIIPTIEYITYIRYVIRMDKIYAMGLFRVKCMTLIQFCTRANKVNVWIQNKCKE